ncbi:MAG TPA: hypothetical protein VM389_08545, partial [Phycisphaerae bacterium]|nr:hypothetical protein [Phycisphaerae bacterium]
MTQASPPPPPLQPMPLPVTAPPARRGMPRWVIPVIVLVVLLVGGLFYGVFRVLGRARFLAQQSICATQLRLVGTGLMAYELDYDALPPDLATLSKGDYYLPESVPLICPSTLRTGGRGYFYHPPSGDPDAADPRSLLACDCKGNHPDGTRNVLQLDGSVIPMNEDQFQAELVQPCNTEFAKALRAAEG